MSFMVSLLFSGMVSLFWNCASLSNILSTDSIMRSWLLHLVTHAWVGRTPSLSASSVFRVLFSFYKFCWCDDLAHISMAVYRFFRASCCKWIGHRIWRLFWWNMWLNEKGWPSSVSPSSGTCVVSFKMFTGQQHSVTIEHFINETCHNTQKDVSSSVCPYV